MPVTKQKIQEIVTPETESRPVRPRRIPKIFFVLVFLLLVTLGVAGYFGYNNWKLTHGESATTQKEIDDLVTEVGMLILLPTDERPTVATVSNLEPLKDQAFFAHATVGDKVLIYANARKAILYDPRNKKIIEVAPISLGASAGVDGNLEI